MGITSYAQNFEDVMLWRAVGHIPNGLYIDVGAQHPIVDSVSKAFYEHGWRGIHIEPTTTYANLLRTDRPDEIIIQAALANYTGTVQFYEIAETGLSTADSVIAARHQEQGFAINETVVPCMTLADVFNLTAGKEIHWLKIDVEGFEKQVLEGWGNAPARPWIIVVESTLPLTTIETHENWEALLLERGYQAGYFDGLNRYYLSAAHPELQAAFRAGPNVFDGFFLYGKANAPFCHLIHEHHKTELSQVQHIAQDEITRLAEALSNQQTELAQQEQILREKLGVANEATRQLEYKLVDQSRVSLEREQALMRDHTYRVESLIQQLQTAQTELRQLSQEGTAREKMLSLQTAQVRQEVENLLRTIAKRESEFAKELLQTHRDAEQTTARQAHLYVEQERTLRRELDERALALTQQIDQLQQEEAKLLHLLAQRESEFTKELLQTRREADQAIAQQAHLYVEQERALRRELDERALALTQQIDQLRQEEAKLLHLLVQRESEFTKELLQTRREADQATAQQARLYKEQERTLRRELDERELALTQQIDQLRQEAAELLHLVAQRESEFTKELLQTRRETDQAIAQQAHLYVEQERALRRELDERELALTQQIDQLREEAAEHLHLLAQRESEFSKELLRTHREAEQQATEQAKRYAEREQVLNQDYYTQKQALEEQFLAKQEELRIAETRSHERERQLYQKLSSKQEELIQLIQTHELVEAQLKEQITTEQHATQLLQTSLDTIHASFAWRITTPIRWLNSLFVSPTLSHQPPIKIYLPVVKLQSALEHSTSEIASVSNEKNLITPLPIQTIDQPMNRPHLINNLEELLSYHDQEFIFYTYQTLLGRDPDPEGLHYYLTRIRNGISKTETIAQLALSAECKKRNVQLSGLNTLVHRYKWSKKPVVGQIVKLFFSDEGGVLQKKIRIIENQIFQLRNENQSRFTQIDYALTNLHQALLQQTYSTNKAEANSTIKSHEDITPMHNQPLKQEELKHFSEYTKDIYFQLKAAKITNTRSLT